MHLLHSYVSDVDIFPNFSFWRVLSLFMLGILQSRDLFFFFSLAFAVVLRFSQFNPCTFYRTSILLVSESKS